MMDFTLILFVIFLFMVLTAIYSLIFHTEEEREEMRAEAKAKRQAKRMTNEANGVHWFWWLFWLVLFFPALIVVAIMHTGRKNRAAIRETKESKQ